MSLVIGSPGAESCSKWNRTRREKLVGLCFASLLVAAQTTGCAHYPVNEPLKQVDPETRRLQRKAHGRAREIRRVAPMA
jgi:hypothetical protein